MTEKRRCLECTSDSRASAGSPQSALEEDKIHSVFVEGFCAISSFLKAFFSGVVKSTTELSAELISGDSDNDTTAQENKEHATKEAQSSLSASFRVFSQLGRLPGYMAVSCLNFMTWLGFRKTANALVRCNQMSMCTALY